MTRSSRHWSRSCAHASAMLRRDTMSGARSQKPSASRQAKTGSHHDHTQCQWTGARGRCRPEDAAPLRVAQRAQAQRRQIRLRARAMRCVHGQGRGRSRLLVPYADPLAAGSRDQDPGRTRHRRAAGAAAAGIHRRAGGAVRLLYSGDDHACAGPARAQPIALGRADPRPHEPGSVPLRNAHAHPACRPPRVEDDPRRASWREAGVTVNSKRSLRVAAQAIGPGVRLSRREFVAGAGALVVRLALLPRLSGGQGGPGARAPILPGSLKDTSMLDAWIRVDADGTITVFTGKVEFGQGVKTALIQLAAEELFVAPARIQLVTADTSRTPNEGYTAGSNSLKDSGTAIMNAAAQVREMLVGLAASRLGVPADSLVVQDGRVRAADGRSVAYGELVAGQTLHVPAQPHSKLRDPKHRIVVGKALPQGDIPGQGTGA